MRILFEKSKYEAIGALILFGLIVLMKPVLFSSLHGSGVWEWWLFHVGAFAVLPLLFMRFVLRSSVRQYHWKFLLKPKDWLLIVSAFTILVVAVAFAVLLLDWKSIFTVSAWTMGGWGTTLFVDLLLLPIAVLALEFFLRGFLLQTWIRFSGAAIAIVTVTLCALVYDMMFAGALDWKRGVWLVMFESVLGLTALRSNSFFASAAVRWMFLVGIDMFVIAKAGGMWGGL